MRDVREHDPRTGVLGASVGHESTLEEVTAACRLASDASRWLAARSRAERAAILRALALGLETHAGHLIATADRESALGEPRLTSELARTAYQLRFMGEVVDEGSYLDASIEHATPTPAGPKPDLRRTSVPLGPVAVFGSSNFPFAFSAPGGDTASAIAAGCAVLVKAHSSHPALSTLVYEIFANALVEVGAPHGVFQILFGRAAGIALVGDVNVTAVGFTGSVAGGRALFDVASTRPVPIPFYGELGSVNPLIVTSLAAEARGVEIADGIAQAMTLGTGQFCTKPGLFLVPTGVSGDALVARLVAQLETVELGYLLNDGILQSFLEGTANVRSLAGVTTLTASAPAFRQVGPVLVDIDAGLFSDPCRQAAREEYFGPFGAVVRYSSVQQVELVLRGLAPALTGTIHSAGPLDPATAQFASLLQSRSGRIVFDGYPTGVAVAWGMNHGGQYPASTSFATSVGSNSIKRWIRPLAFQDAPEALLPAELLDHNPLGIPRRVDGILEGARR